MRSGSRLGAIFAQGGAQVGKKGPGVGLKIARMGAFWESISEKIQFFQVLFSDLFLGCIFNCFGMVLGLILEAFGGGKWSLKWKRRKHETPMFSLNKMHVFKVSGHPIRTEHL